MMDERDPMDRLSSAYRMKVDPVTKDRHIAEMGAAIRTAPPVPVPSRARFGLRRRVAALAGVLVIAAPVGMAVAAETTVPGDFLYPVKQFTERVRAVVTPRVEATHRVEEAERLFLRGARERDIADAVERAESATSELDDPGTLGPRLDRVREGAEARAEEQRQEQSGSSPAGSETRGAESGQGSGVSPKPDPGARSGDNAGSGTTDPGTGSSTTKPPGGSGESTGQEQDQALGSEAAAGTGGDSAVTSIGSTTQSSGDGDSIGAGSGETTTSTTSPKH